MIYIDPYTPHIIAACNNHLEKLLPKLTERVNALDATDNTLKVFLNEARLKRIIIDSPNNLEDHHIALFNSVDEYSMDEWEEYMRIKKRILARNRNHNEREIVEKYISFISKIHGVFKYTGGFAKKKSSYSAYDLAEKLNIQTCVYCNRVYTKTVVNPSKITRPEFDHWYPKESYPILALSFYNLIPSCHICNSSVKGREIMSIDKYLHPYVDENINYKFSYWIEEYDKYDFKIKSISNSREERTVQAFKLEEIYKTHRDEIHDMVRLKKAYSVSYLAKLKTILEKVDKNISLEEMYRLAFGTHLNETQFHKRPLSRMKRDILEELGIINKDSE